VNPEGHILGQENAGVERRLWLRVEVIKEVKGDSHPRFDVRLHPAERFRCGIVGGVVVGVEVGVAPPRAVVDLQLVWRADVPGERSPGCPQTRSRSISRCAEVAPR